MGKYDPYYITAKELAERGSENIPDELQSAKHMIYSSPATLSFNSPGAAGFGVKRAGLAVPESVMLIVAPGCCGRNTSATMSLKQYDGRFFYLLMDDTDIVTGRHLKRIPAAVKEIVEFCEQKPKCVMICITCVDALLGTDMERVCRKCSDAAGVPVRPCYMYALTREGKLPPMVQVRKSIYSILEKRKKSSSTVNLLGEFSCFDPESEIFDLLRAAGVKKINEIAACKDFEEYLDMASANFNIVMNPECYYAAQDIEKRLEIPWVTLSRMYRLDKIKKQYELLGGSIGVNFDIEKYMLSAKDALKVFKDKYPGIKMAFGEWMNADPFEMALAFAEYGAEITEIYGTISKSNFVYLKKLSEISPHTRVYTNLHPTMLYYDVSEVPADVTVGADAAYYQPEAANVKWNSELLPFGFKGLEKLLNEIDKMLEDKKNERSA